MKEAMKEPLASLSEAMNAALPSMRRVCRAAGGEDLEVAALIMASETSCDLPVLLVGQDDEEEATGRAMMAALCFGFLAAEKLARDGNESAAVLASALQSAIRATSDFLDTQPGTRVH